jgi:hypothetical protein
MYMNDYIVELQVAASRTATHIDVNTESKWLALDMLRTNLKIFGDHRDRTEVLFDKKGLIECTRYGNVEVD